MKKITLTLDGVQRLSRKELEDYLKQDPNYARLKDEYQGKFYCVYLVNDTWVIIFNEVGGGIATFLSNPDCIARIFAIKSEILLNGINAQSF
jgi:hypothetical protein